MSRHIAFTLLVTLSIGITNAATAAPTPQEQEHFRQNGAAGLQQFLTQYRDQLPPGKLPSAAMRAAFDTICQQRDCHASRLYWYTDLDQAKAAAVQRNQPILSLRLLGNLDEELSCANSRFFRLALYANQAVATQLRTQFILHWSSERPVPKVTIDFGDGRQLQRTITGNSIHYVLDPQGRPIEAIPGLYGPQAFATQLTQAQQFFQIFQQLPAAQQPVALRQYHTDRLAQVQQQWTKALADVGIQPPPRLFELPHQPLTRNAPSAAIAGQIALSKMMVEAPLLTAISPVQQNQRQTLAQITDELAWRQIAPGYLAQSQLDANSLALMQHKVSPQSAKRVPAIAQQFERNMALDTVRNEYLLHSQLHQWFSEQENIASFEQLNQRVYRSLFLTPASDPWLGLMPTDAFAAIEADGLMQ